MFANLPVRVATLIGALLLLAGAASMWFAADSGRADATTATRLPAQEAPDTLDSEADGLLAPPPARRALNREEQRFARADKDDDGRITQSEYLQQRRRNFDKLDANGDGRLSFDEYATSGIEKFARADSDRNGALTAAEFATTAPKPKNRQTASAERCRCPSDALAASSIEPSQD